MVAALEANLRREAGAVLRLTPPFGGRMRARLHLAGAEADYEDPAPIHVPPERLVEPVPPFPTPDETGDALRADPETTYSRAVHRRRHEAAVEEWRTTVERRLVERVTMRTPSGRHAVDILLLG